LRLLDFAKLLFVFLQNLLGVDLVPREVLVDQFVPPPLLPFVAAAAAATGGAGWAARARELPFWLRMVANLLLMMLLVDVLVPAL